MESQISVLFQIFYTVVPLISIIGNFCIVYVTARSRRADGADLQWIRLISSQGRSIFTKTLNNCSQNVFSGKTFDQSHVQMLITYSRSLRSACNIFIALISGGDVLHMFSHYVMLSVQYVSPDEMVPRYLCIRLQLIPLFGGALSAFLIFTVAIDRLMSLHVFYYILARSRKRLYVTLQMGTAAAFATATVICTYALKNSDYVWHNGCHARSIPSAVHDCLCMLSFFTLVTYVIFLVKVRRKSINLHMREIYRSLIVTSFTVVVCSLTVGFGLFVSTVLHVYSDTMNLLAGLSINISIAANFFVYYAVSKQYRTAINKYLYIGVLKSALGLSERKVKNFVVTVTVIE